MESPSLLAAIKAWAKAAQAKRHFKCTTSFTTWESRGRSSRGRTMGNNAVKVGFGVTASLIAQLVKNQPAMISQFDSWVGKIPWRRERLPTPVFWPGESELDTTESFCGFNPWTYCANYLAQCWPFRLAVMHFVHLQNLNDIFVIFLIVPYLPQGPKLFTPYSPHLWFPMTVWGHLFCLNVVVQSKVISYSSMDHWDLDTVMYTKWSYTLQWRCLEPWALPQPHFPIKCTDVPSA